MGKIDSRNKNVLAFCELNGHRSLSTSKSIPVPYKLIAEITRILMERIANEYDITLKKPSLGSLKSLRCTSFSIHLERLYFMLLNGMRYQGLTLEDNFQLCYECTYYIELCCNEFSNNSDVPYDQWIATLKKEKLLSLLHDDTKELIDKVRKEISK